MELEEPEGDMELEDRECAIEPVDPEGDIELLEDPEGDIEPVDELEGEVTLGEDEEGFFILELDGLEHAPKVKADAITKGSASDFNFIGKMIPLRVNKLFKLGNLLRAIRKYLLP